MTKLYKITKDYGEVFIPFDDVRPATVEDAIDSGYSLDDIYGSSLSEYLDENGKLIESEYNEPFGDYYCVNYWDGNNWQCDFFEKDQMKEINAEIEKLEDPLPAYYFIYNIQFNNFIIKCTQSNMSGSISPYYREYEE